ncbi:MAG: hypothetical protein RJA22_2420 [Verrucomicrobiota bacterium]|jgi:hypothetical protein
MKRTYIRIVVYLILGGLAWFGWLAYRASRNLVTLNVRNAPLRDVVRSLERQTWELIITQKDLDGRVTLNVRDARLEDVLQIISEQLFCRWTAYYPLYTKGSSLDRFKKSVRGELVAAENGWTNLNTRPFGFGPGGRGGGMFGDTLRAENDVVNVNFENKDLAVATAALARYAQAQVVPEDGTAGTVSVQVREGTMQDAVRQVAGQTRRQWTQYYALLGGFRPPGLASADRGTNAPAPEPGGTNALPRPPFDDSEEARAARRQQFEAQLETMSPEEREKAVAERERMEKFRAEMANLTPEQRRERMEQMMNSPEGQERQARMRAQMESRMMSGLKNTTPEQRVERDKFFQQMRQRGGGPGGRGGGSGGPQPPPR